MNVDCWFQKLTLGWGGICKSLWIFCRKRTGMSGPRPISRGSGGTRPRPPMRPRRWTGGSGWPSRRPGPASCGTGPRPGWFSLPEERNSVSPAPTAGGGSNHFMFWTASLDGWTSGTTTSESAGEDRASWPWRTPFVFGVVEDLRHSFRFSDYDENDYDDDKTV